MDGRCGSWSERYGDRLGYHLHANRHAAGQWQTTERGEYFATGIRGPLIGRRADLVIIDDPVKSEAEADSLLLRDRVWNWYRFDVTTRLKPRGRVVLIMTRWHMDDLAGRLLAQHPAEWRVLRLPALAEENDPLERPPGAALWPEWEDEAALQRKRETIGERMVSSVPTVTKAARRKSIQDRMHRYSGHGSDTRQQCYGSRVGSCRNF